MNKIEGIILDVDGVIIGEKIGFNSPNPKRKMELLIHTYQNMGIMELWNM